MRHTARSEEPRRIVLFTPGLHEMGGAARRSRLLAEGLVDSGFEVRVVSRSATTSRFTIRRDGPLVSVQVPGFGHRRLGAALYLLCAIPLGLVWGRSADVYLALQIVAPTTAAGICGVLRRRPFIGFTSTIGTLSEVEAVLSSRLSRLRRALIARATYLVAQTSSGAAELGRLIPETRVLVLPTPVRIPATPPPSPAAPNVVFVGRLAAEKNLHTLLTAWVTVQECVPAARLTLVGEGGTYRPEEQSLRDRVAQSDVLGRSVRFRGWVDDAVTELGCHAVFVLPSWTEGMSNALLEACAASRVVVASDIPGNTAVLGEDYPLLFPPGDPDALARCLVAALSDDAVRREAMASVASRMTEFDVRTVVSRLLQLVEGHRLARRSVGRQRA